MASAAWVAPFASTLLPTLAVAAVAAHQPLLPPTQACDAATGLLHLHRRSIVHRDVKSPNLLVEDSWRVKLADFNLSRILAAEQPANAPPTAGGPTNPLWLAPEILRGGKATPASDTFAFGLTCWEASIRWPCLYMNALHALAAARNGCLPLPSRC